MGPEKGQEGRGGEKRRGEEEYVGVNVYRGIIGERGRVGGGSFLEYTTQKTKGTKIERERGKGEPEVA